MTLCGLSHMTPPMKMCNSTGSSDQQGTEKFLFVLLVTHVTLYYSKCGSEAPGCSESPGEIQTLRFHLGLETVLCSRFSLLVSDFSLNF